MAYLEATTLPTTTRTSATRTSTIRTSRPIAAAAESSAKCRFYGSVGKRIRHSALVSSHSISSTFPQMARAVRISARSFGLSFLPGSPIALILLLIPITLIFFAELPSSRPRARTPPRVAALRVPSDPSAPALGGNVRKGVSIVAVCMNRHAALKQTLPKWRAVDGVNEIVLVDWSSQPPLKGIVDEYARGDKRIKVLRVETETQWVLSRAYNLAMRASSRENVIRMDCDYVLKKDFVAAHALSTVNSGNGTGRYFYAGNYRNARDANEVHLNGAVYIKRSDFFSVGGYDERIQTYGWDDEDLYGRLSVAGVKKRDISYKHVSHVPHDDAARAQKDVRFVQVEIDMNMLLLENLKDSWTRRHLKKSVWRIFSRGNASFVARSTSHVPSVKQLNSPKRIAAAWDLALARRLANDYFVPWEILAGLSVSSKRMLLVRMNRRAAAGNKAPRIFFAHLMHGLGNRLRALASSASFAKSTGRELVIIWEKDAHLSAWFEDLFESDFVVLPKLKARWPLSGLQRWDKSWTKFEFINYMEMDGHGAVKGRRIVDVPEKHMYFKSAYILHTNFKLSNWDQDNKNLKELQPVPEVRSMLEKLVAAGVSDMIGVHIRDRTLDRDIQNVDFKAEYGKQASKTMERWREKSSYKNFIGEMQLLVNGDPSLRFYVATDTVAVINKLKATFPGKIVATQRNCDGRDAKCIRYALVDILALAKTKKLLGSNWSSFTEAAMRFGAKKALLAGIDFAKEKSGNGASL